MSFGRILRLAILCFIVGFIFVAIGIGPVELWEWAANVFASILRLGAQLIRWAGPYMLVGAAIVVPVIVIRWVLRSRRAG